MTMWGRGTYSTCNIGNSEYSCGRYPVKLLLSTSLQACVNKPQISHDQITAFNIEKQSEKENATAGNI